MPDLVDLRLATLIVENGDHVTVEWPSQRSEAVLRIGIHEDVNLGLSEAVVNLDAETLAGGPQRVVR